MKISLIALLGVLAFAGAASAFESAPTNGHKTSIETNRAAFCGTPSGMISKECAHQSKTKQTANRHSPSASVPTTH